MSAPGSSAGQRWSAAWKGSGAVTVVRAIGSFISVTPPLPDVSLARRRGRRTLFYVVGAPSRNCLFVVQERASSIRGSRCSSAYGTDSTEL